MTYTKPLNAPSAVLNMDVVEHVEHLSSFLLVCAKLLRPGGLIVVATINRTLAAFLIAIVGAEYVLGWMPKGTHHWRKLVKPGEISAALGDGFGILDRTGVRINPFDRSFRFSRYICATAPPLTCRCSGPQCIRCSSR